MNVKINTCIIPAAGKGSRWAPVSGYLPKEMLPLIDRPVIEWVVKEAVSSGCNQIVVVINKQKEVIRHYLEGLKSLQEKVEFKFCYQEQPRGITEAVLLAKDFIGKTSFALALPDLPTLAKKPVLGQMIKAFEIGGGVSHIISFDSFPPATQHLYSECLTEARPDGLLEIRHFCPKDLVKHQPHHPGSRLRMSGRYIFAPSIFIVIEKLMRDFNGVEIKEVEAIKASQIQGQQILGAVVNGHTYDTGTPENYVRANTAFFKKHLPRAS